jgi:hypothetical protein
MATPQHTPGAELCGLFFLEAVQPIVVAALPFLKYSAGLLGPGSEVLGFDTAMSMDHDWGPRVDVFVSEEDFPAASDTLPSILSQRLPHTFRGFSTSFGDADEDGTQVLVPRDAGSVSHRVRVTTLRRFLMSYLALDIHEGELQPADWLILPEQKLRTVTSGPLFRDDIGIAAWRQQNLSYYPRDIWLYRLASCWHRIGQEEHLMGRAGLVGDDVGSALIAGRLVRDIMLLCFLMERTYAPYAKWLGTAFRKLHCADLYSTLRAALLADCWEARQQHLLVAYERLAVMHNSLALTEPMPTKPVPFHARPFFVIAHHSFSERLQRLITDERVLRIARSGLIGGVDQFSDCTDLVAHAQWRARLRALYLSE